MPSYPPVEDPHTHSFVLGRFPGADDHDHDHDHDDGHHRQSDNTKHNNDKKQSTTDIAELQTKGGSRYLVQHLEGGTRCDLTGRNRRIEIEFHCHPQSTDRIGMIKEVTTCSYLMVIYTPRLCNDVAFQPPQQEEVYDIECREILSTPEEVEDWEAAQEYHLSQRLVDSAVPELPIIGDIVVGGKKLVGTEGRIIEKGLVASAGEEKVEVVAWKTTPGENGEGGGEFKRLSKEELKKVGLDPEQVEKLKKQLEEKFKGRGWRLEHVEVNGVQDLRAIIESDDDEKDEERGGSTTTGKDDDTVDDVKKKGGAATKEQAKGKSTSKTKKMAGDEGEGPEQRKRKTPSSDNADEGSTEEYFVKDEL